MPSSKGQRKRLPGFSKTTQEVRSARRAEAAPPARMGPLSHGAHRPPGHLLPARRQVPGRGGRRKERHRKQTGSDKPLDKTSSWKGSRNHVQAPSLALHLPAQCGGEEDGRSPQSLSPAGDGLSLVFLPCPGPPHLSPSKSPGQTAQRRRPEPSDTSLGHGHSRKPHTPPPS